MYILKIILLIIVSIVLIFSLITFLSSSSSLPKKSVGMAYESNNININIDIYGTYIPLNTENLYLSFSLDNFFIIDDNFNFKSINKIYSYNLENMNNLTPNDFYNGSYINLQYPDNNVISCIFNNIDKFIEITTYDNKTYITKKFYKLSDTKTFKKPLGMYGKNIDQYSERLCIFIEDDLLVMKSLFNNYDYVIGTISENILDNFLKGDIIPINPQYKIQYKNNIIINHNEEENNKYYLIF